MAEESGGESKVAELARDDHVIKGKILTAGRGAVAYSYQAVEVTELFMELHSEMDRLGYIGRLRTIPHYGTLRVRANLDHSRYDYVCQ